MPPLPESPRKDRKFGLETGFQRQIPSRMCFLTPHETCRIAGLVNNMIRLGVTFPRVAPPHFPTDQFSSMTKRVIKRWQSN
jgi:hypothetical protein